MSLSVQIIIRNFTKDGQRFRPGDWAQRLASVAGRTGSGGRIRFHPKVRVITIDGANCVLVDTSLEQQEPMLLKFLLDFARTNNLVTEEIPQGLDYPEPHAAEA
ncbi:DUF3579 domain-containing protein [Thiohalomonas denitrificans]|uniref:DUF3579 domain-containing protein n=1 Tax=Thiohalomonas denitrificans TaxID=415747 RepID=A0A1G5QBN7_9GAMM|nr:DUF3579 domain-containing protein [Thiohalomonas denitrificans]SCZ59072.1 Protein of unknown function [Thiohalomonas denitrificans]